MVEVSRYFEFLQGKFLSFSFFALSFHDFFALIFHDFSWKCPNDKPALVTRMRDTMRKNDNLQGCGVFEENSLSFGFNGLEF